MTTKFKITTINHIIYLVFITATMLNLTFCSKHNHWFIGNFELDVDATGDQISNNANNKKLTKAEIQGYLSEGLLLGMVSSSPIRFTHTENEIINKHEHVTYKVIKESADSIEILNSRGEIACWVKTASGIAQRDGLGELLYHFKRLSDESFVPRPVNSNDNVPSPGENRNLKVFEILSKSSKVTPFSNSLGMQFVPAGSSGLLFSMWETRVKDFLVFTEESRHDAIGGNSYGVPAYTLEPGGDFKQAGGSWRDPHFPEEQSGEHPVVSVSYLDAEMFCAWLTKKERASGIIPEGASYRLPSDREWSRACGDSEYPWGVTYPPHAGDGNYLGAEVMVGAYAGLSAELSQSGFRDGYPRTSPVGIFKENGFGLYDMGGNVSEWCSTWYTADLNDEETKAAAPGLKNDEGGQTYRVLRGASWLSGDRVALRSSHRSAENPMMRSVYRGFRVVLVVSGS